MNRVRDDDCDGVEDDEEEEVKIKFQFVHRVCLE